MYLQRFVKIFAASAQIMLVQLRGVVLEKEEKMGFHKIGMEYQSIPSVAKIPLSEKVYQALVESIISGILGPGTELREQHIARQMQVSTTPVREALKRLASDGLIEIIPYRGAVVKGLDQREIKEAYACREALEHLAVQQAIERLGRADIDRLYSLTERYRKAEGVAEITSISQQFDDYIYQLSGNQTLRGLLETLKGVISRDRKYSAGSPERQQAIYQEHYAIVQAMERGDVEAARKAVSQHIRNGQRYIAGKK